MSACPHCGFADEHTGVCPTIKAIEYYEDGKIKRVEYKTPADYAVPIYVTLPYYPGYPTYVPYYYPGYVTTSTTSGPCPITVTTTATTQ